MSNLIKTQKELTLDSREVAEMVEKRHTDLLRDIRTYEDYLTNAEMRSLDFFIASNYLDAKNEERTNYQITKKGCEFIAHKLTGQKGVLFTATYINKFHQMENVLEGNNPLSTAKMLNQQVSLILGEVENIDSRVEYLENNMTVDYGQQQRLQNIARYRVVKALGGKESPAYKDRSTRGKVFSRIWKDFKDYFAVSSYKDTARVDFGKAMGYLEGWQAQGKLLRTIEDCNEHTGKGMEMIFDKK